jgi:hypothetical protein
MHDWQSHSPVMTPTVSWSMTLYTDIW